jgi:hypothetical protein
MAKRYGHIGNDVQRAALDALVEIPRSKGEQSEQESDETTSDSRPTS